MIKQWTFSGGIVLAGHKQVTQITESSVPDKLIYPLLQRPDSYAKPIVKPGDHILKGQILATSNNPLVTPIHAASSGIVTAIAPHLIAHPSNLTDDCIIIASDGQDTAAAPQPCIDYRLESADTLRQKIHQAGIVGLGGAAFPTAQKLHTVQDIATLIINGAECEPYISCDESLMQQQATEIVQGALILQYILQAKHCIIALEDNMPKALQALRNAAIQTAIQISTVPAIYPTGGEKQLIQVLTGTHIPAHSRPADYGFICQNVGTAYAVYQAIIQGLPLTERIITVTGKGIRHPRNMRARIGTPIKHLVEQCGGYTKEVQGLIMGGSMMGIALSSDDIAVTKASNCILTLSNDELLTQAPTMPCIRCGDCASVCPAELLPQQLYWYSHSQQLEQAKNYQLFDCIECGCCDVVCPSHIPLVQSFRAAKGEIIIKAKQSEQANLAKRRYQHHLQRQAQAEQEKLIKAEKRKAAIEKIKAASLAKKQKL